MSASLWNLIVRCAICCLVCVLLIGCGRHRARKREIAPIPPAPFQQFVSQKFDWSTVRRVVLMPVANLSDYEHASVEIQSNLAAELQRAGNFDVVVATRNDVRVNAADIFERGQFDEMELLRVAREYDSQAILFCKITQYEPWAPPKLGLSLLMICPAEGVAIASADGLWDAREFATARQAQAYQQQVLSWRQSLLGVDRVLESPDVYQRFVCQQIATSFRPPEGMTGMVPDGFSPESILPASAVELPAQTVIPTGGSLPPLKTQP